MTDKLMPLVNRLRAKGYSYQRVREMIIEMGNSAEDADSAIRAYIKEYCE